MHVVSLQFGCSRVLEDAIFCCLFSDVYRYQFLHFICHMHSSEYKENLKRQIEEQKVKLV